MYKYTTTLNTIIFIVIVTAHAQVYATIGVCSPGQEWVDASSSCSDCNPGYFSLGKGQRLINYWASDPDVAYATSRSGWFRIDGGRTLRSGNKLPSSFSLKFELDQPGLVDVDVRYMLDNDATFSVKNVEGDWPYVTNPTHTAIERINMPVAGTTFFSAGAHELVFEVESYSSTPGDIDMNVVYIHGITITGVKDTCQACPPGSYAPASGMSNCTSCELGTAANEIALSTKCAECSPPTASERYFTPHDGSLECIPVSDCRSNDYITDLSPCSFGSAAGNQTGIRIPAPPQATSCLVDNNGAKTTPSPYPIPPQSCSACPGSQEYDKQGNCVDCGLGEFRSDTWPLFSACRNCSSGSAPLRRKILLPDDKEFAQVYAYGCSGRCSRDKDKAWVLDQKDNTLAVRSSIWHGPSFLYFTLAVNHTTFNTHYRKVEFDYTFKPNNSSIGDYGYGFLYFMSGDEIKEVKQLTSAATSGHISFQPPTISPVPTPSTFQMMYYTWVFRTPDVPFNNESSPTFMPISGEVEISNIAVIGTTDGGAEDCYYCRDGYYSPRDGMSRCLACPAGSYSQSSGEIDFGATECMVCPANYFNVDPGSNTCFECGRGTHGNRNTGSTDCIGDCTYEIPGVQPVTRFDMRTLPAVDVTVQRDVTVTLSICNRVKCGNSPDSLGCLKTIGYGGEAQSSSIGRILDLKAKNLVGGAKMGVVANFIYGDKCQYSTSSSLSKLNYASTEVDMICSLESGVGTPKYLGTGSSSAGCLIVKFEWLSEVACPVCLEDDIVRVQGECINGKRLVSTTRLRACYTSVPIPPVASIVCQNEISLMSWVIGISAGAGGTLLISLVAILWVRNRRIQFKYKQLLDSRGDGVINSESHSHSDIGSDTAPTHPSNSHSDSDADVEMTQL